MRADIYEAIESARSSCINTKMFRGVEPDRRRSFDFVRGLVLAVMRELPDDLSVRELRDEIEPSDW